MFEFLTFLAYSFATFAWGFYLGAASVRHGR